MTEQPLRRTVYGKDNVWQHSHRWAVLSSWPTFVGVEAAHTLVSDVVVTTLTCHFYYSELVIKGKKIYYVS